MYSEWISVPATRNAEEKRWSVLHTFPSNSGRDVVIAVIKPLASNLGISTPSCDPSILTSDREVQWCMEVICFGLGLPLSEHEAIRDCVNVYCEWMLALTKPKVCVPKSICEDPNTYTRKMLNHLYNLFLPRPDNSADIINRQALYCHRVLRTIETVAQESAVIDRETWDALLLFLLAINDTLLAPPSVPDDIGSHLCERILGVLLEVWLLACHRSFPSPSLWKTFRELACSWRHRIALVDQWNRVNLALTSRVLQFMYGSNFPNIKLSDDDAHLVPSEMSNECIAQAWFRFLHTLGNPVDLCRPEVISQTPKFYHFALSSEMVVDPCQHPCLAVLPQIFYKAMKGISNLVDVFLGIAQLEQEDTFHIPRTYSHTTPSSQSSTPPHNRRGDRFSKNTQKESAVKSTQKTSLISGLTAAKTSSNPASHAHQPQQQMFNQQTPQQSPISTPTMSSAPPFRLPLSPSRPKCNSVLHLFGTWLFEAALVGSDMTSFTSSSEQSETNLRRPSSLVLDSRQGSAPMLESFEIPSNLTLENFEAGQAEAVGSLCRIFCAKRTGEEILPVYLARFYLALQYGLSGGPARGHMLASILMNSSDLLRKDLDGVMVLVPQFLLALELVLPGEAKMKPSPFVAHVELRNSAIHLLLSMLPLPLHFFNLPIKTISAVEKAPLTFQSLRIRLVNILINALQVESESTNTHMLLGGLLFYIQDSAASEEVEQITQPSLNDNASVESVSLQSSELQVEVTENCDSLTSSECSSLGPDLDNLLRTDFPLLVDDSTHALFLRATYLICHRLISSWKTDLNVSLAALEVLSGLARIHLPQADSLEGKRAVKWICDYIVFQCSRPPPAHSKDLHSTIVAAYHCVTTWLMEHPDLLNDKDTVHIVLEVVELGISGSKSQPKKSDPPKLKGDKELKPASLRVKDAAEAVLACMLDHVGCFPPPCGPQNLSSLLDEKTLIQQCNNLNDDQLTKEEIVKHFRYFALDNSIILGILEQHLGNEQDPQPTLTALVRAPFGRHAWCAQLRHLPHHKSGSKYFSVNPGRPLPMNDVGTTYNIKQRYLQDAVDKIPMCQVDKSIPSLEEISRVSPEECEKLAKLIENQINFESSVKLQVESQYIEYPNPETECKAPSLCEEFQTSRLFLSHLGFLNTDALKETLTQPIPSVVSLEQTAENFLAKLEDIDNTPSRTVDTVFIFYVRSGQTSVESFLQNVGSPDVHPHFSEFLRSLGWPVDVKRHAGWTGHISTAWKILPDDDLELIPEEETVGIYNGKHKVLYWSDVSSELAFVVPNTANQEKAVRKDTKVIDAVEVTLRNKENKDFTKEIDRRTMPSNSISETTIPRAMSLNLDSSDDLLPGQGRSSGRKFGRQHSCAIACDMKVVVVWLENLDDHISFPLVDILPLLSTGLEPPNFIQRTSEKDLFVIFVHPLQSGLFQIKLQGPAGKMSIALPLVDGMVVSRRTLGTLVRQTALNMLRRKRLDADSCQPPHVRRKLKIQEVINRYHKKLSESEFISSLFQPSSLSKI
ncbi:ral GTPase-activating protein subunit beta-like isoform X3 [Uloborus diversus]|uniref:ral GTPase-activating protein subunit beta-like isoform X2 n=1 Tax=Uloborus diversus TaxID=327109 RepID=UPI002409CEB3|nr:ral GTPase-activating protein subunit beta-like isoform X2 [Uloborus diversus]XP_054710282.1 ral GTPase-activating protein subunit beta-like isoform X3 [Uloborus diversus]